MKKITVLGLTIVLGLFLSISAFAAGNNAISSLPYTISTPGYYYVNGNLSSAGTGIVVNANDVTVDLNSYTITGPGDPGDGYNFGVTISGSNIEVKNGTIRNFDQAMFSSEGVNYARAINVRAVSNATGIRLLGKGNMVEQCHVSNNSNSSGEAIAVGAGSTVASNVVHSNASTGILTFEGSTIIGNTVYNNAGNGIVALVGSTVKNNTVYSNGGWGIELYGNNLVDGNTSFDNNELGGYGNANTCTTCTFGTNHMP